MNFISKLEKKGQKKILSLDGGGILGLMTVEILAKIEKDLRESTQNENLVLSDFFDFICGTSTGGILATCISAGMSMDSIRKFYIDSGEDMFDKASIFKRHKYKYEHEALGEKLKFELNKALGYPDNANAATLGDENLNTLLMLVMRNHTTDSPWFLSNNPYSKYNNKQRQDCNLNLPLWQLVRASTAAPTYFKAEEITFAKNTQNQYTFTFVDGGVTTYNNPAFIAFQMATAKPYNINWKTGVDNLLIVSIGTGSAPQTWHNLDADELHILHHAKNIPTALMNAASAGWDMTCRTLGHCRFGRSIDNEYGKMLMDESSDSNWTGNKLFSYVRYDPDVTKEGLAKLGINNINPENIQTLDAIKFIDDIQNVGKRYANQYVDLSHFGKFR